jgi:hypothetical protein
VTRRGQVFNLLVNLRKSAESVDSVSATRRVMIELPPTLRAQYRVATSRDVRSWSFGELKATRPSGADSSQHLRGTLFDQIMFGPVRDHECYCGKFRGIRYKGMICDRCGVKITTTDARRTRFGHIELPVSIGHPCGEPSDTLDAFPVVPAVYFESVAGARLGDAYEALLSASSCPDEVAIVEVSKRIAELLAPIVIEAHRWNLQDASILARGIGLEPRASPKAGDWLCETCGYPLSGLNVQSCPGCGRKLSDEQE